LYGGCGSGEEESAPAAAAYDSCAASDAAAAGSAAEAGTAEQTCSTTAGDEATSDQADSNEAAGE